MPKETQSAECPICHRQIRIYIPKGGDGSASFFVCHKNSEKKRCEGSSDISPEDKARDKLNRR